MNLRGDFKQLPPATSMAPFIILPWVHRFDFRVLRENRRIVQDASRHAEIEEFHEACHIACFVSPT